jgi:hypothetical protein
MLSQEFLNFVAGSRPVPGAAVSAPRFPLNRFFGADWALEEIVKDALQSGEASFEL